MMIGPEHICLFVAFTDFFTESTASFVGVVHSCFGVETRCDVMARVLGEVMLTLGGTRLFFLMKWLLDFHWILSNK